MRLDFSGDTYDLAKRFLMRCLAPDGPWGIVPMFTDGWSPEQVALFEKLLGGKVLISNCIKRTRRRQQVTTAGDWVGHVLIDPDKGIQFPDSNRGSTSHARLNELVREAQARPTQLILVFDQSYANAKIPAKIRSMKSKLAHLEENGVVGFGYRGQASFLILSCDPGVLQQARKNLLAAGVPDNRLVP